MRVSFSDFNPTCRPIESQQKGCERTLEASNSQMSAQRSKGRFGTFASKACTIRKQKSPGRRNRTSMESTLDLLNTSECIKTRVWYWALIPSQYQATCLGLNREHEH